MQIINAKARDVYQRKRNFTKSYLNFYIFPTTGFRVQTLKFINMISFWFLVILKKIGNREGRG